ncbi:hypothetical protein [Herpetosiphon giganteus]|uniref:hypothetical protein n=1 Tax=Herpetosiphon giganteus TaxID=2029754 RepID=UPI00195B2120|nr:hypothetical protein [Herpetosiphon giganteus]MBM7846747.1 uncharacterized protein YfaP (DUF2135 family) [Herpetosiphon giganteus]
MSDPSTFGYVTTNEARKTLHLTNMDDKPSGTMRGTFIHEYFHHAQGHSATTITGKDLLINGGAQANWFIEGTARWIEDELLDSLDTYMYMEGWGSRIAEVGIHNGTGNGLQRPYQRFSFFKLLTQQCPQFDSQFRTFLNVDLASDPSGIVNLSNFFNAETCNFGAMLGSDKAHTLAAALTYYNYGTQFENKLSLFDSNETTNFDVSTNTGFRFDQPNASFQGWKSTLQQWLDAPTTKVQLNDVSTIAPAGAYSFRIPALSGALPSGKVAEFIVESGQEVFVSITSASDQFKGENTIGNHPYSWFSTKQQTSYPYAATGTVPELFVTIVNPSLQASTSIKIFFHVRDELTLETAITSHTNGDSVSKRVETIAGIIPEAARATTTKVTLTINGIATDTPVNADGTFSIEGVMALGDNLIKAQGIDGSSKPTTKEQILTLRGIESSVLERNALLSSRAVFVLRWDTNGSDIDIYTTDTTNNTIWFNNLIVGQGILDYDDTDGFGPEVISYRTSGDDGYANGSFEVDVHYYNGAVPTTFTLDVVLNETEGSNRRVLRFQSAISLPGGMSSENGPAGSGSSRVNDIMRIGCSTQAVCSLTQFDPTILTQFTEAAR